MLIARGQMNEDAVRAKLDKNQTAISSLLLLGFQGAPQLQFALFTLFLVVYITTIGGNLWIITLVPYSKILHSPMYFFLTQLSISDIVLSSDVVPNLLNVLLNNSITMSFTGCLSQLYIFMMAGTFECLLLTVMSYDRFTAICNPLQYNTTMTHGFCTALVLLSWLSSIGVSSIDIIAVCQLWFCGPNVINHFYCDMEPLLDLSCSDTSIVRIPITILSFPVLLFPFGFIVISYSYIIYNILRISSTSGRQKAFSTCSSHLIAVSLFYGTLIFTYLLPTRGQACNMSKLLSLLYTVATPLINPMIYSLRNKDIKTASKTFYTFYNLQIFAVFLC
ncbi:olfactory receptor 10A7-like [Gastrophryne carolinensis]